MTGQLQRAPSLSPIHFLGGVNLAESPLMSLSKGDRLGPYEILALVGKGGMGEVYRAHDDRVNRDVAIKVSSARFTERFTREARTIALLNHTNICHLYDVGPNYLVMEFVEGQDLRGPLGFADALPIVEQLIDGIEAAHEKNVIHRDLKPANIKFTPEGVVKILDFGLAKAMEPPSSHGDDPDNSPTFALGGTQAGTILGTAAYMSPEQAKGKRRTSGPMSGRSASCYMKCWPALVPGRNHRGDPGRRSQQRAGSFRGARPCTQTAGLVPGEGSQGPPEFDQRCTPTPTSSR